MKIVQINAVAEYSSTGRTTSELHSELKRLGHQSWIAAPNVKNGYASIKIGSFIENKFHAIFSRITGRQGYASYFSTKRLIKRLKMIRPDVIHLRNLHANYINLPLLFSYLKKNKIPTVITLHDCWPFTGHCCYFIDSNCNRWKKGCGNCHDLKNWNPSLFFDFTHKNLEDKSKYFRGINNLAVIGVSDWVTNFVKDSILRDSKIVRRIYNWIDVDLFKPDAEIRRYSNSKCILGVSQIWNTQKGLTDFISLAKLMPNYSFILVGKIVEQIEIPDNIKIIGPTSNVHELIKWYNKADVFFNPSTRETFGKVTAEAISCGTPVVAYNATATPELISEDCGFIVDPGDIEGAKKAIEKILEKKDYRRNCRLFAEKMFSKNNLIKEYIKVYEKLINE